MKEKDSKEILKDELFKRFVKSDELLDFIKSNNKNDCLIDYNNNIVYLDKKTVIMNMTQKIYIHYKDKSVILLNVTRDFYIIFDTLLNKLQLYIEHLFAPNASNITSVCFKVYAFKKNDDYEFKIFHKNKEIVTDETVFELGCIIFDNEFLSKKYEQDDDIIFNIKFDKESSDKLFKESETFNSLPILNTDNDHGFYICVDNEKCASIIYKTKAYDYYSMVYDLYNFTDKLKEELHYLDDDDDKD